MGGTHPALVEAMGYGNCVLVNDTPENREVAGDAGLYFRADEPATLSGLFERVRRDPAWARDMGEQRPAAPPSATPGTGWRANTPTSSDAWPGTGPTTGRMSHRTAHGGAGRAADWTRGGRIA